MIEVKRGEVTSMDIFKDQNGCEVRLSFEKDAFTDPVKHVLVMPMYNQNWVLTKHSIRGLEFPGGKIEPGETPEEAAKREVYEETGAKIHSLSHLVDYQVADGENSFVKSVYFAQVKELHPKDDYLETGGPILVQDPLISNRQLPHYSFIMKDEVVTKCLEALHQKNGRV